MDGEGGSKGAAGRPLLLRRSVSHLLIPVSVILLLITLKIILDRMDPVVLET